MRLLAIMLVAVAAAFTYRPALADDAALAKGAAEAAFYESMSKLGEGADGETRRLIAVAMAIAFAKGGQAGLTPPVQPAPVIVQNPQRHALVDLFFGIVQTVKDLAQSVGPTLAQVHMNRRNTDAQIRLGEMQRDTQAAIVNGFVQLGASGFSASRDIAGLGFAAATGIADNIPQPGPQTTFNVSGAGNNFGGGSLTYNPITGSYNPVNPSPTVVTCVGTPPTCSR